MQEFEKYPKLTEYIQEMANTGRTPREWTDFLYQLNQALRQPPVSGMLKCCSCGYEYEELIISKGGILKCNDCAS